MILAIGAFWVVEGKMTVGYLITANTLLNFIIQPFRKVATSYISVKSTTGIRKKIDTLLSIVDSEIAESGSYDSLIGSRGLLFNMMHSMNMEREGKYRPRKDIA